MQLAGRVSLVLFLAAIIISTWLKPLDSTAIQKINTGINNAVISFTAARVLNAAISVVQGTEVSIEPGGVGVNLAPGQILHPIHELIEQFSTLMLAACVAFGVQKILIIIGGYKLISLVLTTAAIGWGWFYYRQQNPPAWLSKILVILLMVRFAIPIVTIGTDLLFREFLANDYKTSQDAIKAASGQVAEINLPDQSLSEDRGWLERMKGEVNDVLSKAKPVMHYNNLKQSAEQWVEHIINLIVIFLLQTLVIPLLLMWALYAVVRGTFKLPVKVANVITK
jgi:hypothetical protein